MNSTTDESNITITPEGTDELLITSKPDEFKEREIVRLYKRAKNLDQQLEAISNQVNSNSNATNQTVLQNQIAELKREMQIIRADLADLE